MRRLLVFLGALAALSLAIVFVVPLATVARVALNAGMPSLAIAILKPAAAYGDAVAMNDLGVLLYRGEGTNEDPAEAARLLLAAAESGLPRAKLNLALVQRPPCRIGKDGNEYFELLEEMARSGDVIAASFAAECFGRGSSTAAMSDFAPWGERLLSLAQVGAGGDGEEKIKFAWTLIEASKDSPGATPQSIAVKTRLLDLAAKILLEARDEKPAAYYGLAVMRDQYADHLQKGLVADDVMRLTSEEWLLEGAKAGHQVSGCRLSERYMRDYIEGPGVDKRARLQRIAEIIRACLVNRTSPRAVIFVKQEGRTFAKSFGEDFAQYRWRSNGPLLVTGPKYEDHDFDTAAHSNVVELFNELQRKFGA